MTAEGSTGAPLRQQIAEAIHATGEDCFVGAWTHYGPDETPCAVEDHLTAADAVVALLDLTEWTSRDFDGTTWHHWAGKRQVPSTPPDIKDTP